MSFSVECISLWFGFDVRVGSCCYFSPFKSVWYKDCSLCACSIYMVHDEVKDKSFELEMSWVGEGKSKLCICKEVKHVIGLDNLSEDVCYTCKYCKRNSIAQ